MMKRAYQFLKIIAAVFILYGLIVLSLIGPYRVFSFFYLAAGIALYLISAFSRRLNEKQNRILFIAAGIAALCFLLVEARIIAFSRKSCTSGADALIVLGSQVKDSGPSMDYQARLDSAYEYLIENPDTIAVCTGAKGDNEPVSEAKGGADYLIQRGIRSERILIEDRSFNTIENLANAKKLLEERGFDDESSVVIISADYHLYRAKYIAEKLGYQNVSCKGGHGLWLLLPHYYTREFFALFKEYIALR